VDVACSMHGGVWRRCGPETRGGGPSNISDAEIFLFFFFRTYFHSSNKGQYSDFM
jgi:hypothetical protein